MTPLLWAETTCTITISRYEVVSELLHGAPNVVPHSRPGTKSKAKNFRCQGRKLSANSLYVKVFDAQSLIKEVSLTAFLVYPGFWILGTQWTEKIIYLILVNIRIKWKIMLTFNLTAFLCFPMWMNYGQVLGSLWTALSMLGTLGVLGQWYLRVYPVRL